MSKLRLHLDADTSIKALQSALTVRGHDVTRTPNKHDGKVLEGYRIDRARTKFGKSKDSC